MWIGHYVGMTKGLTLGQFQKLTAHLHPDTEIILDDPNGSWYFDVESIALPDEGYNGFVGITLFHGQNWDNRCPADEPCELVDTRNPERVDG